jgi:hypothetical protein
VDLDFNHIIHRASAKNFFASYFTNKTQVTEEDLDLRFASVWDRCFGASNAPNAK